MPFKTKHLKPNFLLMVGLLSVLIFGTGSNADARCWSTITHEITPCPCLAFCYSDGLDQSMVWELPVESGPSDKAIPELQMTCPTNPTQGGEATTPVGDPVSLASGQFIYNCQGLRAPGKKIDLDSIHTYSSGSEFNNMYGRGWILNYYMRLHRMSDGDIVILKGNGMKTKYMPNGGIYVPEPGWFETLQFNDVDATWTLTLAQGTRYNFDEEGRLSSIADRNNNTITLAYTSEKFPVYAKNDFQQNSAESIATSLDYRLSAITDTTGRVISLNYNAKGLLESVVDGTRQFVYDYDATTQDLLSVTKPSTTQFPSGVTKTFTYDDEHNVTAIEDEKGQTFVENVYDTEGRVEEQILGGHSITLDYSVPGQVTETDRRGNIKVYTFDTSGNLMSRQDAYTTSFTYNAENLKTSDTLPRGNGTKYTYDDTNTNPRARANLLTVRQKINMGADDDPDADLITAFSYEPNFNLPKTITDPKGKTTTFIYDYELLPTDERYGKNGNVVQIIYPTVNSETPIVNYTYNTDGQVAKVVDPQGNVIDYEYFPTTGYLKSITLDPSGINAKTEFTYDQNGNIDKVTDALGRATDFDYDALGWLNQIKDAQNYRTRYYYDQNGNVTTAAKQADTVGLSWISTRYTYNILNKVATITDPLNKVTTLTYDENDNLHTVLDAEGNTTTFDYNSRDLLWKTTDANTPAGVTENLYDENGNLVTILDANLNPTTYTYDLFDRLERETFADASFHEYTYDKNSNLETDLTPKGDTIGFTYDELNRLTAKTIPGSPNLNVSYVYDLASRLTDVNTDSAQIHYDYDNLNRVQTATNTLNSTPYTLSYLYDKVGNRTRVTYPSGTAYNYTYNAIDQMDLIQDAALQTLVNYDYDYQYRQRSKRAYGATGNLYTQYYFDALGRLNYLTNMYYDHTDWIQIDVEQQRAVAEISLINRASKAWDVLERLFGINEVLAAASPGKNYRAVKVYLTRSRNGYTYDSVGNRLSNGTLNGLINYGYNDIYELTNVSGIQNHSYAYDNVGNRETADNIAYVPNNLNQYSSVDGVSYTYDANGNLTNDGTNTYTYDVENRLTSHFSVLTSNYTYDGLGRRVSKTVDGVTTYFVYDGDRIVEDRDSTGTLLASYLYGEGIDEVLSMSTYSLQPTTYWFLHDGLGSVTDIVSLDGKTLYERYQYDPYGNVTIFDPSGIQLPESSIQNRFTFTGRELDSESPLYYYRARMYSPMIGRFLQRDPIGYYEHLNLYQYTGNDPINFIDPFGLWEWGPTNWAYATLQESNPLNPKSTMRQQMRSWGAFYTGDLARAAALSGQSIVEKTNTPCGDSGWQKLYTGSQVTAGVAAITAAGLMAYESATGIRIEFHTPHSSGPHQYPHLQEIQGPGWGKTLWRWPSSHPWWWPKL